MTMDHRPHVRLGSIVIGLLLAAACGGSPTRPSTASDTATSLALTQASVGALVFLAHTTNQSLAAIPPRDPGTTVVTLACPGGGSIAMTFDRPVSALEIGDSHWNTTARAEPRDCRSGDLTVNGDPYLLMDSEVTLPGTGSPSAGISMTTTMSGSLRFDAAAGGSKGRVTYDCRQSVTSGTSLAIQWTGTISWALENGNVIVGPCGPA